MANSAYNEILMEHNLHPDHKCCLKCPNISQRGINPSCGDEITLQLEIGDDNIIKKAAFSGQGCAISQASTDIMADLITGKSTEDAKKLSQAFIKMIRGEEISEEELSELDEATALKDVAHMPARVKCALLAWRTLEHVLSEREK